MKIEEQLEKWLAGESVHNDEREECCPDFSCCTPGILASESERRAFAKAYREEGSDSPTVQSMLLGFLGRMVGSSVHVAGNEPGTLN